MVSGPVGRDSMAEMAEMWQQLGAEVLLIVGDTQRNSHNEALGYITTRRPIGYPSVPYVQLQCISIVLEMHEDSLSGCILLLSSCLCCRWISAYTQHLRLL